MSIIIASPPYRRIVFIDSISHNQLHIRPVNAAVGSKVNLGPEGSKQSVAVERVPGTSRVADALANIRPELI
jgi:hypothetical protein